MTSHLFFWLEFFSTIRTQCIVVGFRWMSLQTFMNTFNVCLNIGFGRKSFWTQCIFDRSVFAPSVFAGKYLRSSSGNTKSPPYYYQGPVLKGNTSMSDMKIVLSTGSMLEEPLWNNWGTRLWLLTLKHRGYLNSEAISTSFYSYNWGSNSYKASLFTCLLY